MEPVMRFNPQDRGFTAALVWGPGRPPEVRDGLPWQSISPSLAEWCAEGLQSLDQIDPYVAELRASGVEWVAMYIPVRVEDAGFGMPVSRWVLHATEILEPAPV